jgi:uroporphyrinogen-III synthase
VTDLPLTGKRIVVTRARTQSVSLVDRLERLGATVVELPVIAVEGPADGGSSLAAASDRLVSGAYDWVALTSPNAAARLFDSLAGRRPPDSVRWAAVGAGTAGLLLDAGVTADLVPRVSLADSLADAFPPPAGGPAGTVLFPRAEKVRGGLAPGLRAKGWTVEEVVAYRTVAGDPSPEAVASAGRADAVAFTSSSTVEGTIELLGRDGVPPVVATIGPVTSSSAVAAGLVVSVEAEPHTLDGLVAALLAELGEGRVPGGRAEWLP